MRDPNAYPHFTPLATHTESFRKDTWASHSRVHGSKYNTLLRNKDSENEKRRDLFQKKVKQQGEDRRWEIRGDQILRTDFLTRQKQWEEEQARRAAELAAAPDEDMDTGDIPDRSPDVNLFEEYLSQEDQELTVMSSMSEEVQSSNGHHQNETSDYGSDDEEFERLLMDAVQQMEYQTSSISNPEPSLENHDMDMTIG
ncbi:hypothetical protein MMC30_000709 [Trapelia coarctata]|nr:hypothetical protein [Trapelia coarctata]